MVPMPTHRLLSFVLLFAGACAPFCATSATLKLDAARGLFTKPFAVTISSEAEGTAIYYTTNGSPPSPELGSRYLGPFTIPTTTILRSAGFKDVQRVTEIDTRTFIFPSAVTRQTGAGFPATWGTNQNKPVPADYEMDPEIVNHPAYRGTLEAALKSIPSLSIVMDNDDLFGAGRGIYSNPMQSGAEWERGASVEFLPTDGSKGFQAGCGVRIQGGWNRRPEESPKHAFRLVFRKKYGQGKLKHQMFERGGPDAFNELILRSGCNNTWLHWHPTEREHGDYIRDQWMRESQADLGHPAVRGVFVHLYLNGLYWGLYNLTERPNENFAADHFGGKARDYDARNGENILSGDDLAWKQMLALANAGLKSDEALRAIAGSLDLSSFIDYMLLNLYAANGDWDRHSNWYAARRRNPPGPFHFFVWDGERTIERLEDNTIPFDDDQSPPRLFQKLRENPEFRLQFAERVQKHLFDGGALSPVTAAARYQKWADQLDSAIIAESARWGDYRRDAHPYKVGPYKLYTRDDHWRPEVQRLLKDYFPHRTDAVLKQFREAGLYPETAAPTGRWTQGKLELSATEGTIRFTDDGSDPRLPGGVASPSARVFERALSVRPGQVIKARANRPGDGGAKWSALVEFQTPKP